MNDIDSELKFRYRSPMPPGYGSGPVGGVVENLKEKSKLARNAVKSSKSGPKSGVSNYLEEEESEIVSGDISVENPMFGKRRGEAGKSKMEPKFEQLSPENDPFSNKMMQFSPKPPTKPRAASPKPGQLYTPAPPSVPKGVAKDHETESTIGARDDIDPDEEREKLDALPFNERIWKKKLVQRVIVGLLAVALLWSTSLGLIRYIIEEGFFPKPSMSEVGTNLYGLFNETDEIRNAFTSCAFQDLESCSNTYELQFFLERMRVYNNTVSNENDINFYEVARFNSKVLLNSTLNQLIFLVSHGLQLAPYLLADESSCPRVRPWIEGQVASSLALGTYDEFTQNASEHIDDLVEQMRKRREYDAEYMHNKSIAAKALGDYLAELQANRSRELYGNMNGSYGDYGACMEAGGDCGGQLSIFDQFEQNLNDLGVSTDELHQLYDGTQADVDDFYNQYRDLFDVATGINQQLANCGAPCNGIARLPTGSTPKQEPGINFDGLFEDTLHTDEISDALDAAVEEGQVGVNAVGGQVEESVTNFGNETGTFYADPYGDTYNPPPVDTDDPVASWDEAASSGKQRLEDTLKDFNQATAETTADDFEVPTERKTNFPETPEEIVALLPERPFDFYAYDTSLFDKFSAQLDFAVNGFVWADVCYRVLHTIFLLNKYWSVGAIGKPPGDARLNEMSGRKFGQKASAQEKMLNRLTHPAFIYIVSFIFIGLIADAFWRLYSPFYEAYKDGCVEHNARDIANNESEGTMIYRNLYTVAFQYATQKGDDLQSSGIDKINVQMSLDCEAQFQTSQETFENQLRHYFAILDDWKNTKEFRNEVVTCLDLPALDALETDPDVLNMEEALNNEAFFVTFNDLLDALYNCSAIALCDFRCPDPPQISLQTSVHQSSCTAEWWLHASLLSTLLVTLTFILMQIFRIEFMKAVVRIWWRHLNPFDFNFLGSCTIQGEHIDPEQVTEDGHSFRKTVRDALGKSLKSWERYGYFRGIYAISLNAPWIAIAILLSRGVSYN